MQVIYDESGKIFFITRDSMNVEGSLKHMEFEIPDGMDFDGVDHINVKPIFKSRPKTEMELLREELALTKEMAIVAVESIAIMNEEGGVVNG